MSHEIAECAEKEASYHTLEAELIQQQIELRGQHASWHEVARVTAQQRLTRAKALRSEAQRQKLWADVGVYSIDELLHRKA